MDAHRDATMDSTASGAAMDAVLSAGATAAALTSTATATSIAGTVATAAAAVGATEAQMQAEVALKDQAPMEAGSPKAPPQSAVPWDAHLDNPTDVDPMVSKMLQLTRRAALGITSESVGNFMETCEFISLGCFCAASNALQLLGLKRNSYPFDWVRSSNEGIMHCLDMQFEDFLTYSTYLVQDQYVIFGGTRWGGSFWHHNLEVPVTRHDMTRRVNRFFGRGNVPACTPRFFVRCVNSTREITAALRLRKALREALPEAQEIYLLIIVDLQAVDGPMVISDQDEEGLLFYGITETETQHSLGQGSQSFRLCSESYARAVAFAIKHFCGESKPQELQTFDSLQKLCSSCVQFDGGDPARELFTPRKFYGQDLDMDVVMGATPQLPNLFAKMRVQMFLIPDNIDTSLPFQVEVFGKSLKCMLPPGSCGGCWLHLCLNEGVLSASATSTVDGQTVPLGPATVEEVLPSSI